MSSLPSDPGSTRRSFLLAVGASAGAAAAGGAVAQTRTATDPPVFEGKPVPEPSPDRSAGPIRPMRGSSLKGKRAVVTGGARGIGRAIAVEFAANGADVALIDIAGPVSPVSDAKPARPEDLEESARQVRALGRQALPVRADIRDFAALRAAADQIERQLGAIDIVVANAAIQNWRPLLAMKDPEWRDIVDNNLTGTANTIRAFAPKLVARRRGRVIVVASMQGKHGTKDGSAYSASKWGVLGLMKSAAIEFGEYGVTVNAILPGLCDTALTRYEKRFVESMGEQTGHKPAGSPTPEEAWNTRAPTMPLKIGWMQPEDVSPVAVFLASDAAAMVTGAGYEITAGDSAKSV